MNDQRVIKKYPNRRLYDMAESRYVTINDIRKLVMQRVDFVILDKRDDVDITRSVLLQVIAEQERCGGEPVMSRDFLTQMIRSHGGRLHRAIGSHLDQSLRHFFGAESSA
jgi:polyhydroxyalkanoate synthesis repressor PhaR